MDIPVEFLAIKMPSDEKIGQMNALGHSLVMR